MIDKNRKPVKSTVAKPQQFSILEVDLARMVKRHWGILMFCIVLGWGGAAAYYLLTPPTYESKAEILLAPKDPGLAARGLDSKRDTNSTLSEDLLATHMMLIQSPAIVREGLRKAGLLELPSLLDSKSDDDTTVVDYVIRRLYVSRGGEGKAKNAQVLSVAMRHENAEDAQKVVTAVVDEFREFISKKYADVNQSAAELIEKAQGQLGNELETAEQEFREFRENAPLLWNGDKSTNIYRTEYEQIESTLTDLRMQRSDLNSRLRLVETQLERINEEKGSDVEKLSLVDEKNAERMRIFLEIYAGKAETQIFQSQQPERLEAARGEYEGLMKLKARLHSLVQEFGEEQPEVKALKNEIKTIEEFIQQRTSKLKVTSNEEELTASMLVDAYVSLLRHDIQALADREELLTEASQEAEAQAKSLVQYELDGEAMRLAVDRQRTLFDATVDRLREINLAKDFGGFVNELIREPELGKEVWPKLSICGALGTLVGLLLGSLGAFVREVSSRSFRNLAEVEKVSGLPNISLVPLLETHRHARSRRAIAASKSKVLPVIVTHHFPNSQEAEIFRGLRTAMLFKCSASDAKVIAVTSPSTGDGKSTVLANLAVSLAQAGRRILLIDADMRRPSISRTFGITNSVGLSDLLTGQATLFNAVVNTETPKLDLLLAGKRVNNPAELLASGEFQQLLEQARTEYDMVLVDCPPVLAVADPCEIAPLVDAMLIVIRVNPRSQIELQRTIDLLSSVKSNILGTVVNASKIEVANGSGGEGFGYGYGTYGDRAKEYFRIPGETDPVIDRKSDDRAIADENKVMSN